MTLPRKVYLIYNTVTHKGYVGSSGNVKSRIKAHFSDLRNGHHNVEDMQKDYDEYGDHFIVKIIDTILNSRESCKEQEWMRKLNTFDKRYGYNYKDNLIVPGRRLKRTKNFYEYHGELLTAGELSLMTDIPYSTLQSRLLLGWSAERAITEPVKKYETWQKRFPREVKHG